MNSKDLIIRQLKDRGIIPPPQETSPECPSCGIELRPVMSYSCPNAFCPCGMGKIYSMNK